MRSRLSWRIFIASTVLNCILAYAANFCFKCLGPVVGNSPICPLLSTSHGFCAWTTVDHMIKLMLCVLLMRSLDFVLKVSLFMMWTFPAIGVRSYFSFPVLLEHLSSTLQPSIRQYQFQLENFKTGCSVRHSQYLCCC